MATAKSWRGDVRIAYGLTAIGFILLVGLLWTLKYDPSRWGDNGWYWQDSLNWRQPYNPFHMPGYPLTLALLAGRPSACCPPPSSCGRSISRAPMISLWAVYRLIEISGAGKECCAARGVPLWFVAVRGAERPRVCRRR